MQGSALNSHADHLNTPRVLSNATSTTVWRWDQQEPFGVNEPDENPSGMGAFDLPVRLPGQAYDRETITHYTTIRVTRQDLDVIWNVTRWE